MKLILKVIGGPYAGKEFEFDGHDTFLVGRSADAHLRIPVGDPYFSRRHFVVEVNPPRCRLIDLNSRNGTYMNGERVQTAEVADGDEIGAGHTVFKVQWIGPKSDLAQTLNLPVQVSPAPATIDYRSDTLVQGFRIQSELARGGMGVVYRAVRENDGMPVAIKTIIPSAGATQKQIDRFLRECRILSQLDHPNIVAFRDVGVEQGVVYLVMDLVEGVDLSTKLKDRGPLEVRMAVRITCQLLAGLAHAHSRGFVHRDVKPSNVIVTRIKGKRLAKLADFGLARVYETSNLSGLLQGEIGGTPAYMAPEQVTHYRDVMPAADQYSAAATLYRMLTNRYIHDLPKETAAQLSHIVSERPIPITSRRSDISVGLAAAIHKALNPEPKMRFNDVLDFRKSLMPFANTGT